MNHNTSKRRSFAGLLDKLPTSILLTPLETVLDRKGRVTTHTYDPLNRRAKTLFHDGTSTNYTYDAGNRITQVQEKNAGGTVTATITRAYDGLDRLTQEVTAQGTVNYTYNNASRRATTTAAGQSLRLLCSAGC